MHPVYTIYCEVSGLQICLSQQLKKFAMSSCDFTKNDRKYPYGAIFWPTFWITAMQGTDSKASYEKGHRIPFTKSFRSLLFIHPIQNKKGVSVYIVRGNNTISNDTRFIKIIKDISRLYVWRAYYTCLGPSVRFVNHGPNLFVWSQISMKSRKWYR